MNKYEKPSSNSSTWLEKLTQLAIENLENDDLSNVFLAQNMNVSEAHFYRLVKEKTGKSPNKFIRELRLNLAKKMLESGEIHRVSLVAYKVGFQRVDYFSRLYEERFGVRPSSVIS